MKKSLLFLAAIASFSFAAQAQSALKVNPSDSTKVKRETIVIVNESAPVSSYNSNENKNFIKINPLLLINGDLPVYYERGIGKGFSIEGALGLTMQNIFLDAFEETDNGSGNTVTTEKEYDFGVSFSLNPRFYPSFKHDGYTGWFFGPMFRQQNYNSRVHTVDGIKLNKEIAQTHQLTDFKLMFGYTDYIDYDRVFYELYTGVGPRMKSVKNRIYSEYDNNNQEYMFKTENFTDKKLSLALGAKLGIAF